MQYTTLGNTGLQVSVAGLGCGGNSRLGLGAGKTETEACTVVQTALDLGVNFLDTAAVYGTEHIVGQALANRPRDAVIISTKAVIKQGTDMRSAQQIVTSLEHSLKQLNCDYVDIFHLHGVPPAAYDYALRELAPALLKEKDKGKLRCLGITETSPNDPQQLMLQRAVHDPCWQVVMLAYHMMSQNARKHLFDHILANGIGTLVMFVVRNIFSVPGRLQATMQDLAAQGKIAQHLAQDSEPLAFLLHPDGASSVIDAAYRFARHQAGTDVVLFGTSSIEHLKTNIESILKPPLPEHDVQLLHTYFGELQGVGLELPERRKKP